MKTPTGDELPSYLAHLAGKTLSRPTPEVNTNLVCFNLANASTKNTWSVQLRAGLPGYATDGTKTVALGPSSSSMECLSPTMNLSALYSLTASTTGAVTATVSDVAGGATISSDSHSCTIAPAQMVYWVGNGNLLFDYASVLSMPDSPAIGPVLTAVKNRSGLPGGYGMGPYTQVGQWFASSTSTVAPNNYIAIAAFAEVGELIQFNVTAVAGGDVDLWVGLFDSANFTAWKAGQTATTIKQASSPVASTLFQYTPTTAGTYYFVFLNTNANWTNRTVTTRRTITRADVAWDVLFSIFNELKSRGLSYLHIGTSYFDNAQRVRWPEESLYDKAANCIDGTLLFSSIAELAGVDPVLIMVPGHAFFGIRGRSSTEPAGTGRIWPIETTNMGTTDAVSALTCALTDCVIQNPAFKYTVDVVKMRQHGITPIPR